MLEPSRGAGPPPPKAPTKADLSSGQSSGEHASSHRRAHCDPAVLSARPMWSSWCASAFESSFLLTFWLIPPHTPLLSIDAAGDIRRGSFEQLLKEASSEGDANGPTHPVAFLPLEPFHPHSPAVRNLRRVNPPNFVTPLTDRRRIASRLPQPGSCCMSIQHLPSEQHIRLNPLDDWYAARTVANALPDLPLASPAL